MNKYRVHFTCEAGHTSYSDYHTLVGAVHAIMKTFKLGKDWYWTKLEVVS